MEHIPHQSAQALGLGDERVEVALLLLRRHAAGGERLGVEADERQRRAQLVADVGDEALAQTRHLHLAT